MYGINSYGSVEYGGRYVKGGGLLFLVVYVNDSVSVSENVAAYPVKLFITVNETVTVTEGINEFICQQIVFTYDILDVTELWFEVIPALKPLVYDSIAVSESLRLVYSLPPVYETVTVSSTVFVLITSLKPPRYESVTVSEYVRVFVVDCEVVVNDIVSVSESVALTIPVINLFVFDSIIAEDVFSPKITALFFLCYEQIEVLETIDLSFPSAFNWHESITVSEFFVAEIKTHNRSTLNTPFGGYIPDIWEGSSLTPFLWGDADN